MQNQEQLLNSISEKITIANISNLDNVRQLRGCFAEKLFQAEKKVLRCYGFYVLPTVKAYSFRSNKRAGQCRYSKNLIEINTKFLKIPSHIDYVINQTLLHEYAHLLNWHLHRDELLSMKRIPHHGKTWRQCMRFLGLEANTYHNMKLPLCKDVLHYTRNEVL